MNIVYTDKLKGIISSITSDDVAVPFHENMGPALYYKENGKKKLLSLRQVNGIYIAISHGVQFSLEHIIKEDCLTLRVDIYNNSDKAFMPEAIGLCLGIDSYMVEYPQWNNRFFPTYMRCEKTHFIGYFMSPQQKAVAVVCKQPVAAWELEYNTASYGSETDCHFGHRIYTGNLLLTVNGKVPKRHPQDLRGINAGENKSWEVNLIPLNDIKKFKPMLTERFDMPVISCEMYTVAKGEKIKPEIMCGEEYSVNIISPSGKIIKSEKITADEYGVYTVTVKSKNGKICEAKIYCRHDYGWYLKAARKNAVYKPQKATTHTESWYGHFSNFLAKKHYPDTRLDTLAKQNFDEIMPLMYDFENGKVLIAPDRVQNEALLISLLTDAFEAEGEEKYLDYANNMAQELMSRQADSGAYMSGNTHYIYCKKHA